MTEAHPVPVKMSVGGVELFVGHVDADDLALRSDELRQNVSIAAGARAQIEHAAAAELGWHHETAAVILPAPSGWTLASSGCR